MLAQSGGICRLVDLHYRALPAKTLDEWHAKGWVDLVTLHLASQQSFQNLLDLNAQRANEQKALA
jgi:hypothetical protein